MRAVSRSFMVCSMVTGNGVIVGPFYCLRSMPMSLEHEAPLKAATGRRYFAGDNAESPSPKPDKY